LEAIKPSSSLLASFTSSSDIRVLCLKVRDGIVLKFKKARGKILCFPMPLKFTSCYVIYNISHRGGQSTSLANLFCQENETATLVLHVESREASVQIARKLKWDCTILGVSRNTTQKRDLFSMGEKPVHTSSRQQQQQQQQQKR
jgi:hypothetical protein